MAKVLLLVFTVVLVDLAAAQKNIVFILGDDIGYNDVSWHNPSIITPNLEALANSGIKLGSAYVQPQCTPTRSALMTGYYPIHTGRQSGVINGQMPVGLFTNFTLLPERLNQLGYRSHAVGKWHLGFCSEEYLPTRRGFHSFHGFYAGLQDHFDHITVPTVGDLTPGFDYRANDEIDWTAEGEYSSTLVAKYAGEVITEHVAGFADQPLFMYVAFSEAHFPLQVPDSYLDLYPELVGNPQRRHMVAMVTAMDEAVGAIVGHLVEAGLYEDTIIVFSSDNGGSIDWGGSNLPLRGEKASLYEGGSRSASFISVPFLPDTAGTTFDGVLHVTDWLPTLYVAAGGPEADLIGIDGINQWDTLINNPNGNTSMRTDMLYNIMPSRAALDNAGSALRKGEMKLICGDPGSTDSIIPNHNRNNNNNNNNRNSNNKIVLATGCRTGILPVQLFNLTSDPNEKMDLALEYPDVVEELLLQLEEYEATMIPPNVADDAEEGNPNNFGGVYSTGWCISAP